MNGASRLPMTAPYSRFSRTMTMMCGGSAALPTVAVVDGLGTVGDVGGVGLGWDNGGGVVRQPAGMIAATASASVRFMSVIVEPLDATLGARVTGVRLAGLSEEAWDSIEAAFHEHAILVFPGQHLSE